MRVFVTGHLGLIGKHIVGALEREGHIVVGYDKAEDPADDIADRGRMIGRMKGCLSVIHLAGIPGPRGCPWAEFERENVDGTRNVLEAAISAKADRFVYASTGCVYGFEFSPGVAERITEDSRLSLDAVRNTGYTRSKIMSEMSIEAKAESFPGGAWVLRVDGPGESNPAGWHNGWQCPWSLLETAFIKAAVESKAPKPFVVLNVGCGPEEQVDFTRQSEILEIQVSG